MCVWTSLHIQHCLWPPDANYERWTQGQCVDMATHSQVSSSEPREPRPSELLLEFHTPEYEQKTSKVRQEECAGLKLRPHVCKWAPSLVFFLIILHLTAANHGIWTHITIEIRNPQIPNHMLPLSWGLLSESQWAHWEASWDLNWTTLF